MNERGILRLLRWFCPEDLYEGISGDLLEALDADVARVGMRRARVLFLLNTIRFFRPSIIMRKKFKKLSIGNMMFFNNLKAAYRNMAKSKGYSFINIFGLSLGIASCLLTFAYVRFEFSYDEFHHDTDRTYRVNQTFVWNQNGGIFGSTGLAVAHLLSTEYPEVEQALRINQPGSHVVRYQHADGTVSAYNEEKFYGADSTFFNFFNFPLKEGDPQTALLGLDKIVISEEVARKFFGDEPALGKVLEVGDQKIPMEITGVTVHQPENSHFRFDYLQTIYSNRAVKHQDWSYLWTQSVTYVKLRPGASAVALEEKLATVGERKIKPTFARLGIDYNDFLKGKGDWKFFLMPFTDVYLNATDNRVGPVGNVQYALTFAAVGAFVLLIAAINFINLSTARASKRAKEVGVKKTLGALRRSLVGQFLLESIMVATLSTVLALGLAEMLRWVIASFVTMEVPFSLWSDVELLFVLPLVPVVIGVLAGIYPAFYLTAFRPAYVLKGRVVASMNSSMLRSGLVILQFGISVVLMIGTIVVYKQLSFMSNMSLGFNKENIIVVRGAEKLDKQIESFRNELASVPGVQQAAIAMDVPAGSSFEDIFSREGTDIKIPISIIKIDEYYFNAMGFQLIAGRQFDQQRVSDVDNIVVNETAVRLLGFTPETALGQKLLFPGNDGTLHEIIGVMNDFHYQSLRQEIGPMLFTHINSTMWGGSRVVMVRFQTDDVAEMIRGLERKWNLVAGDAPFVFTFFDEELKQQYLAEQRLAGLFGIFSGLSIVIAIIGLVGLVAYSAEVRRKEISIRKVFGASRSRIVIMMNTQYARLIGVSLLFAIPVSWLVMIQWLQSFEYRTEVGPGVFLLAGAVEILLALVSVAYLSFRAAAANPAAVLKEE